MMCGLGSISVRFFERKCRRMPKQTIMQIRVKIMVCDGITETLQIVYDKLKAVVPLLSYIVYDEGDYWYADYKFLII